jgi:hypothetical protein
MKLLAAGIVALSCLAGGVQAVYVQDYSLEEKVRLAELVVIGQAVSTQTEGDHLELAHIQTKIVLKGSAPEFMYVVMYSGISELGLDCCKIGHKYLFFLMKTEKENVYLSVNGRFGAYEIP